MATIEHTPGPWEYRDDQGQIFGPSFLLAELVAADSREEHRANGRLIAAAPDLLAALKLARDIIGHPDDDGSKLIAQVIARATKTTGKRDGGFDSIAEDNRDRTSALKSW